MSRRRVSSLTKKLSTGGDRLLLVTAHPDDETLFFAPLLLALKTAASMGYGSSSSTATYPAVKVLCLSTGNFYGQGERRKTELVTACSRRFGLDESSVCTLDVVGMQDGFDKVWAVDTVAATVLEHARDVDVIVTFDEYGVSGHPNHCATHHGVRRALEMNCQQSGARALLGLQLHSTNSLRKFAGVLDVPYSLFVDSWLCGGGSTVEQFFVLNCNVLVVLMALLDHRSQLQWYRVAFVLLSRFSYINTYSQIQ